jgi:hypothetical protein
LSVGCDGALSANGGKQFEFFALKNLETNACQKDWRAYPDDIRHQAKPRMFQILDRSAKKPG